MTMPTLSLSVQAESDFQQDDMGSYEVVAVPPAKKNPSRTGNRIRLSDYLVDSSVKRSYIDVKDYLAIFPPSRRIIPNRNRPRHIGMYVSIAFKRLMGRVDEAQKNHSLDVEDTQRLRDITKLPLVLWNKEFDRELQQILEFRDVPDPGMPTIEQFDRLEMLAKRRK